MSVCISCSEQGYLRCNCESAQPYCDPCADDTRCTSKMDAQCVVYHLGTDEPTELTNLNMPNGSSAEEIFEAIDDLIGSNFNIPFAPVNTRSIEWTPDGPAGHHPEADVILSDDDGQIIVERLNGLFAENDHKVKVDEDDDADFLENQIEHTNSSTGTVDVLVTNNSGIVQISAEVDVDNLIPLLCAHEDFAACLLSHETDLTANDSSSVNFTPSGVNNHTLTASVILSPDAGNDLEIRGNGLFVDVGDLGLVFENALTESSGTIHFGGALVENTIVSDRDFNLVFDVNTVQIGDVNTLGFTQTSPYVAGENRKLNVYTKHNLKTNTAVNTSINSVLTLANAADVNTTTQVYAGASSALFNFEDAVTFAVGSQLGSLSGQIGLTTRNSSAIGFNGGPIAGVSAGVSLMDASPFGLSNTASQGTFAKAAGLRIIAPVFLSGSDPANTPDITDYYGIHIGESDNVASNITNPFGIYQIGANDVNRFFGPVQNAGGGLEFTSDIREKENINSFSKGLDQLLLIDTYTFNYKYNKDKAVVGVIAQQLEKVIPEAVNVSHFETPGGKKYDDFRYVDQNVLFYTLLNAVKELAAKVKSLENV